MWEFAHTDLNQKKKNYFKDVDKHRYELDHGWRAAAAKTLCRLYVCLVYILRGVTSKKHTHTQFIVNKKPWAKYIFGIIIIIIIYKKKMF